MAGFSDKLKHERESRNASLADVARRTRIGIEYLEALERGDFDGLPGRRGFGKLYIRVYADLFGFDPEPLISEYEEERLERERPKHADRYFEPQRPRKIRFVPRPRRPPDPETGGQAPTPPLQEPVSAPTATPAPTTEPDLPLVDPCDAGAVTSAEAVEEPAAPDPVDDTGMAAEVHPPRPGVPSVTQAAASVAVGAPSWKRRIAAGAIVLVVLGALGVIWKLRASRPVESPVPEPPASAGSATPAAELRHERSDAGIVDEAAGTQSGRSASTPSLAGASSPDAQPASTPPAVPMSPAADSRPLDISEFDLGTGVVDRRVVGVRREFEEGAVAWFLTRVRGGAPGQAVRHVWLREGSVVQSIELRLGGPNWRTYSKKTLWGAGDWAVEARDGNDRVLARVEFRCVPTRR